MPEAKGVGQSAPAGSGDEQGADLCYMGVAELGRLYRSGAVSPPEVTRAVLGRIDRYDDRLRAYITVTADRALEEARRAESELRAGQDRGPLHGVTVALNFVDNSFHSQLISQGMPKRSTSVPKRSAQNVFSSGTTTLPPLASS